jgi:hypothetical protein
MNEALEILSSNGATRGVTFIYKFAKRITDTYSKYTNFLGTRNFLLIKFPV